MNVVFFGTPEFAVPSLNALLGAHDVLAVVTRPDRPRGRGHKVSSSPVKLAAEAGSTQILQPSARLADPEVLNAIADLRPDIAVVTAYGRLLPQALLDIPRLGFINVHASLLPRWRGAAPIHRAVIAGDSETGITIMRVVLALDAGPMLAKVSTVIEPHDTSETLERRLGVMGADLLIETMARIEAGTVSEVPQDEADVTYAPKLERHESEIDWSRPASAIGRQMRGLQPWPLAAGLIDGRRVAFLRSTEIDVPEAGAVPGTIVAVSRDDFVVACGSGALRVSEVLPEGRRAMAARDFLNGTAVRVGTVVKPLFMPGAAT
jgi:methionyl-tRNA formyltransferase